MIPNKFMLVTKSKVRVKLIKKDNIENQEYHLTQHDVVPHPILIFWFIQKRRFPKQGSDCGPADRRQHGPDQPFTAHRRTWICRQTQAFAAGWVPRHSATADPRGPARWNLGTQQQEAGGVSLPATVR